MSIIKNIHTHNSNATPSDADNVNSISEGFSNWLTKEEQAKTKRVQTPKKVQGDPKPSWKDLCAKGILGLCSGRAIADSKNKPVRTITDYMCVHFDTTTKDGKDVRSSLHWMASENYIELTPEQKSKNDKLGDMLRKLWLVRQDHKHHKFFANLWVFYFQKYHIMFMKVRNMCPNKGRSTRYRRGDTAALYHQGEAFVAALANAVKSKPELLEKCFSREIGSNRYVLNITTTSRDQVNIDMVESSEETELTQEDLDKTKDLGKILISNVFDDEQVEKNIKTVEELFNNASEALGTKINIGNNSYPQRLPTGLYSSSQKHSKRRSY